MKPSLNKIFRVVCEYFEVSDFDMKSRSRSRSIVYPRQVYFYLAETLSGKPLEQIGYLAERDHATVIHAVNKISIHARIYRSIAYDLFAIRESIFGQALVVDDVDLLQLSINHTEFLKSNTLQ